MPTQLINAALQTLVSLGICALAWFLVAGKKQRFRDWIGLHRAPISAIAMGLALGVGGAALLMSFESIRSLAAGPSSAPATIAAAGLSAATLLTLVIVAIFKTALAEELLFRGLIGKRLINRFGFAAGNTTQAMLFGAAHLALLLSPAATAGPVTMLVVFATASAFLNGWLNERFGGGSILPGWAAHATANLISYFAAAAIVLK
jgi:membrane protease YdiL (CAAX protease family)